MFEPKLQGCIKFMKDHAKTIEKQGYPPIIEGVLPYYKKTIEYLEQAKDPKHGVWLVPQDSRYHGAMCSECGEAFAKNYNFCPNCGADMRGGDEK